MTELRQPSELMMHLTQKSCELPVNLLEGARGRLGGVLYTHGVHDTPERAHDGCGATGFGACFGQVEGVLAVSCRSRILSHATALRFSRITLRGFALTLSPFFLLLCTSGDRVVRQS